MYEIGFILRKKRVPIGSRTSVGSATSGYLSMPPLDAWLMIGRIFSR